MNYPITVARVLVLLAFFAHTFVSIREAMSTRPVGASGANDAQAKIIERNWVQSLCAFQLVTIDLFVLAIVLLVLGTTEFFAARRELALGLAGFFLLWGLAWLIQLLVLRRRLRDYLVLSQWFFWFVCTGLLLWGSQLP